MLVHAVSDMPVKSAKGNIPGSASPFSLPQFIPALHPQLGKRGVSKSPHEVFLQSVNRVTVQPEVLPPVESSSCFVPVLAATAQSGHGQQMVNVHSFRPLPPVFEVSPLVVTQVSGRDELCNHSDWSVVAFVLA